MTYRKKVKTCEEMCDSFFALILLLFLCVVLLVLAVLDFTWTYLYSVAVDRASY
jgi:hypothetical protein